jgi:predicted glycosyltransferase
MNGSALIYVQTLLGIGHTRRAFRLAEAVARQGIAVTVVSGGELGLGISLTESARVIQLAPIRAYDATFKDLIGPNGRPIDQKLKDARRDTLLAALRSTQPDVVVIETFPFGRRAFRFEIEPLIEAARLCSPRPRILCSVRDIVISPDQARRLRDIVNRIQVDFDLVLVHGDPNFIPLEASFSAASEIANRLIYTGYIGDGDRTDGTDENSGANEVLISVGGGAVGGPLLSTALEARRCGCLPGLTWRLIAGPNLPEQAFGRLSASLPEDVVLERYRAEFPQMLRRCRVSVSQAGYNTIFEILAAAAHSVVVPFASERETEQQLRAERLAAQGVLELLPETQLTAPRLAQAIQRAIDRTPCRISVDTSGASRSACIIADMIRGPTSMPAPQTGILCRRSQAV